VALTVWDFNYTPNADAEGDPYSFTLDAITKQYVDDHPVVTVEYVGVPFDSAYEKYRVAIAAKTGPDIVTMYPGTNAATFSQGLLPLEDRITPTLEADLVNLAESYSPDGHLYALPHALYAYIWAYNKDVFRSAGLPTTPPATWEELLSTCRTLAAHGRVPIAIGFQEGWNLEALLYMFGDQTLSPEERERFIAGDFPLNSEAFVRALEHVEEMVDSGCFSPASASQTWDEGHSEFRKGDAGMTLSGIGWGDLEQGGAFRKSLGDGFGIFPTPPLPDGHTPAGMTDAGVNSGFSIMRFSQHPDEAFDFITYVLAPAQQARLWEASRTFPNSRGALESVTSDDPMEQQELEIMANPANFTIYTGFPLQTIHELYAASQPFITGDESPQEVLDAMQEVYARVMPDLRAEPSS
jgi:ABC-type glycerol-3-phosphate transport system substrate-binding protein